jgi:hypothetical protein
MTEQIAGSGISIRTRTPMTDRAAPAAARAHAARLRPLHDPPLVPVDVGIRLGLALARHARAHRDLTGAAFRGLADTHLRPDP